MTKKGEQLEEAVYSAFKALGFNDITKKDPTTKKIGFLNLGLLKIINTE